jgi:hypothetical protein
VRGSNVATGADGGEWAGALAGGVEIDDVEIDLVDDVGLAR